MKVRNFWHCDFVKMDMGFLVKHSFHHRVKFALAKIMCNAFFVRTRVGTIEKQMPIA